MKTFQNDLFKHFYLSIAVGDPHSAQGSMGDLDRWATALCELQFLDYFVRDCFDDQYRTSTLGIC